MPDRNSVVVSVEHAGNEIPERYRSLFDSDAARTALDGHRGWDPGSSEIAEQLAREMNAPLVLQRVSRLLVECNRSLDHPALWSEFTRGLPDAEKRRVLDGYWHAHRDAVRRLVDEAPEGETVVHLGVHTFTPVWRGRPRPTDVGLLFDPGRGRERRLAGRWRRALARAFVAEGLRVHLNLPYRGWTDGLTTTLRGQLPADRYVGLELELSQRLVPLASGAVSRIASTLRSSLT